MTAVDGSDKSFEFSYDAEESIYTQTPTSLKSSQTYTPISHINCRQNLQMKQLHVASCASLQPPGPMPLWPQRRIRPRPLRNFTTLPLIHTTLPRRPLDLTFLASHQSQPHRCPPLFRASFLMACHQGSKYSHINPSMHHILHIQHAAYADIALTSDT